MKVKSLMIATILTAATASAADPGWRQALQERLPLLGHRNWIIVADSAFPLQISPGVETIYTGEDQLTVLETVMKAMAGTRHITPIVYLDAELKHVPETRAPGIDAYRAGLKRALGAKEPRDSLHEDVLKRIDQTGRMYKVLMLKTNMTLPYTTVFLELDCGYWGPEAEQAMRAAMGGAGAAARARKKR